MRFNLDTFTRHYLIAALWSTNDESNESGGAPMDVNHSIDDIASCTVEKAIADCARFQTVAHDLLTLAYAHYDESGMSGHPDAGSAEACAGHDFWLARNRHGVGFWDRGMPDNIGAKITSVVCDNRDFPEIDLYVGDDGKIYS